MVPLWIDQVSINQTDDSERKCQVQVMAKTFAQAHVVIGWLGDTSCDSDIALKFCSLLSKCDEDGTGQSPSLRDILDGLIH